MIIRSATESDQPRLVALDSVVADEPARAAQISRWIAAGHCHLVEQDGSVCGYAVLTTHFFDRPFIEMLMVAPEMRGEGYGSALVRHLIACKPGTEIWTSTNQSNSAMQNLLAGLSFTLRGSIDLDPDDPELVFRRLD